MKPAVADTLFCIDLMRKDPAAIRLYQHNEDSGQRLSTTGITALELYKGAFCSADGTNLEKSKEVLSLFSVIPVDEQVYEVHGDFLLRYTGADDRWVFSMK